MKHVLLITFLLLCFSACFNKEGSGDNESESKEFVPIQLKEVPEEPGYMPNPFEPTTPQELTLDNDCRNNTLKEFCIFKFNPVHQKGARLSGDPSNYTELASMQNYRVKIEGAQSNGTLRNANFRMVTLTGTNVQIANSDFNITLSEENLTNFLNAHTFFWLNYAVNKGTEIFGSIYAINREIQVFVTDQLTGWSSAANSLHFDVPDNRYPAAMDSSLIAHHFAFANLHYAGNGAVQNFHSHNKHKDCGTSSNRLIDSCCSTYKGCSLAIASGTADYFQARVLGADSATGSLRANELNGLNQCGISRDLDELAPVSATDAYNACTVRNASGYINVMGAVYASIWWELRNSISNANPDETHPIDRLYQLHLPRITSDDDFVTVYSKIIQLDQEQYTGAHSSAIRTEFLRRGIPVP